MIFIFLLLFLTPALHAATAASPKSAATAATPFITNSLFIFLDDQEPIYGPIARDCAQAIEQQVPMILVSNSLLKKVLTGIYPKLKLKFDEDSWTLRQVGKHMTLMIGINVLRNIGLHLLQLLVTDVKRLMDMPAANVTPADYFLKDFEPLFVTGATHQWFFFLDGHGFPGSTIASLPIDQFKRLLEFFENKINTKLFAYLTCFAMGTNSDAIYKGTTDQFKGHTYPFIIATNGVAEMLTGAAPLKTGHDGKLKYTVHYDQAIKQLMAEQLNFETLLPALFGQANRFSFVRMPGLPWFNAHDANSYSFTIGRVMERRDTPLDLSQKFSDLEKDIRPALLLYARTIPFELNLGESKPHFVSMTAEGVHHFEYLKLDQRIAPFLRTIANELTIRRVLFTFKTIESSKHQPVYPERPGESGRRSLSPTLEQPLAQKFTNVIVDIGVASPTRIFLTYGTKEYELVPDAFVEYPYSKEYASLK